MIVKVEFEKPEGFNERFSKTLAECVGDGIVEAAIRRVHDRDSTTGIDKQAQRG